MIAKIGRGVNIYGVLSYNQVKVNKEHGEILLLHKMLETLDGSYSVNQLTQSFEPYLLANRNTEKPVLHISLNPDPRDRVSDEKYKLMAQQYMQEMGYGNQPFVVFKHTDIERTHIHIVSVCVDEEGRKISDSFERKKSMHICRSLEEQYKLIPASEKNRNTDEVIFQPVDYKKGDIKSQIAAVVRYLPTHYQFQSLGAFNALLSLFNITSEEVKGEYNGQPKHGLVYLALNDQGEKASNPFKSSLFGKSAGISILEKHFEQSKAQMKTSLMRDKLKTIIDTAMQRSTDELSFKKQLNEQGVNAVIRRNSDERIYGITFIDHNCRSVWNGSQLGKHLSANVFDGLWNESTPKKKANISRDTIQLEDLQKCLKSNNLSQQPEQVNDLFDFLLSNQPFDSNRTPEFIEGIGSLLPETQGEDYEELDFAKRMKKKAKKKR